MSYRTRRALLLAALPLAAFAAWEANEADSPISDSPRALAAATPARGASVEHQPVLPRIDLGRLERLVRRHASEQPAVDPFAAPRPPQPAKQAIEAAPPAPPLPPQAPPLPFRYLGRQELADVQTIFLEQQEQVHITRVGEEVANGWRLDAADDHTLTFTYVPLGQQRRLHIGSAG